MYESDSEVGCELVCSTDTTQNRRRTDENRAELRLPIIGVVSRSLSLTIDPIRTDPVEVHQRRPVYPTSPRSPPFFV